MYVPSFTSRLRKNIVVVPSIIEECSGIRVFGQLLKSFLFSTDVAIIRNTNANAIIAVYPFTPHNRLFLMHLSLLRINLFFVGLVVVLQMVIVLLV
ncbi:MAG: hypothetical protein JNM36_15800 [Chitinophagales bacterium]|nr:hypothetical protein [Chitinophagales bacterium]